MTDENTEPQFIGSPQQIIEILRSIVTGLDAKNVLDCPGGQGPLAQLLLKDDLDVPCCDIYPEIFKVEEIVCEFADLNNKIHYADAKFDVVVCLNGMQRVWARGRAVREPARVIKPGG